MKDRNTCCYIYHVEIDELQIAFNNIGRLFMALIVPATIKSMVLLLLILLVKILLHVVEPMLTYFLKSPKCGKTLSTRKVSLCNGINGNFTR